MTVFHPAARAALFTTLSGICAAGALGDVTMEQRLEVQGPGAMQMLNMSGTVVATVSGDRARTDSDLKMESRMLRMFAGGSSTEIVRLDEEKVYQLDMKKKTYTETTFAEQRAAMEESMAQMREAQSPQQGASGIDESECEWSEPTATVNRTGEKTTIAGYDAERMTVTASQSCADPDSEQVCTFNLVLDQWLAPDFQAAAEVTEYYQSYAGKLGLDVAQSPEFSQRLETIFGSYQGIWSEIASSMEEAEGYPVRSKVSLAVGGPQCQTAQDVQSAKQESQPGVGEAVGSALGGALGGIFGRRRDQAAREEKAAEAATAAPEDDPTLPEGTVRLMSVSSELVSVSNDDVPVDTFEIPAGFKQARK